MDFHTKLNFGCGLLYKSTHNSPGLSWIVDSRREQFQELITSERRYISFEIDLFLFFFRPFFGSWTLVFFRIKKSRESMIVFFLLIIAKDAQY